MLTEMTEISPKIEEKVKAMQGEIKKNIQRTNSEGRETGTQINDLKQKEEIKNQLEQNEKIRIFKNEERLRNLSDNFIYFNIRIIGVAEGGEEEQEIENLFQKIMKEKVSNLAKELGMQA